MLLLLLLLLKVKDDRLLKVRGCSCTSKQGSSCISVITMAELGSMRAVRLGLR